MKPLGKLTESFRMERFHNLRTWKRKHQSKIMGRYHVDSFLLLPAWKRKILGKTDNKIAATSMWTKVGFTITKATTSTMTNSIFFFFLSFPWQGAILSIHTAVLESGDISKNLLVHQPSILTVPSGNPPEDRTEETSMWKLRMSRELPGNQVENRFDITVHHQRHQIRWGRTSVEIEAQRQTSVALRNSIR